MKTRSNKLKYSLTIIVVVQLTSIIGLKYVIDPVIAYSLLINRLTKGTRDVICKIIELSARAMLINCH